MKLTPVSVMVHATSWRARSDVRGDGARYFLPAVTVAVVGITGVAVVEAVGGPVVVGAKKNVVAAKVKATPTVPPMRRRAP